MDVAQYFDPDNITAAYCIGSHLTCKGGQVAYPEWVAQITRPDGPNLAQLRCLYLYLQSPVIVRPPLALCRALANTDLPIPLPEYHQPWPILG